MLDLRNTLCLEGNDLVDIPPRADGIGCPIYLRDHCRKDSAPVKETERFVWLND